jgi:hypothetical protein
MSSDFSPQWHSLLEYRDGRLYWKIGKVRGKEAGTPNGHGYKVFKYKGKMCLVHRVVFEMFHARKPSVIDHIDCDGENNRIENLRECSYSDNVCNQPRSAKNTVGEKNVYWCPEVTMYRVRVSKQGVRRDFGYFKSIDAAAAVAKQARESVHKEFANHE